MVYSTVFMDAALLNRPSTASSSSSLIFTIINFNITIITISITSTTINIIIIKITIASCYRQVGPNLASGSSFRNIRYPLNGTENMVYYALITIIIRHVVNIKMKQERHEQCFETQYSRYLFAYRRTNQNIGLAAAKINVHGWRTAAIPALAIGIVSCCMDSFITSWSCSLLLANSLMHTAICKNYCTIFQSVICHVPCRNWKSIQYLS